MSGERERESQSEQKKNAIALISMCVRSMLVLFCCFQLQEIKCIVQMLGDGNISVTFSALYACCPFHSRFVWQAPFASTPICCYPSHFCLSLSTIHSNALNTFHSIVPRCIRSSLLIFAVFPPLFSSIQLNVGYPQWCSGSLNSYIVRTHTHSNESIQMAKRRDFITRYSE